jgi:hypothetical protein
MLHPAHRALLTVACLTALYPASAFAEVSDKEPTTTLFWAVGLTAALLCFLLTRLRPWLGSAVFLFALLWFAMLFGEIHSPDISLHLQREQGFIYYLQAYAAFVAVIFGFALGHRLRKRHLS